MSNLAPISTAETCASDPGRPTLQELPGRLTDLSGLAIRRLLPRSQRRLVGETILMWWNFVARSTERSWPRARTGRLAAASAK